MQTHSHSHTQTLLHRDALVSILLYCCRKKQHYCYYCCCSLGMHCQQKMLLLSTVHAVCIKQGTTRKAPCVCHCVCSVALLRLSTVMWIHNPISHKNFEERLQWEIPLISTTKCLEMFRRSRIHIFEAFALILASFMMELKLGLHYIWLLFITAN